MCVHNLYFPNSNKSDKLCITGQNLSMLSSFCSFLCWIVSTEDPEQHPDLRMKRPHTPSAVFRLYTEGDSMDNTCTLESFRPHTLTSCGFNSSLPLIIITHGWSVRPVLCFLCPGPLRNLDTLGGRRLTSLSAECDRWLWGMTSQEVPAKKQFCRSQVFFFSTTEIRNQLRKA